MTAACLTLVAPLWPDVPPAPRRPRHPDPRGPRGQVLPFPARPAPAPWQQLSLPLARPLPLFPDLHAATRGLCLAQQDACAESDCRHHLGAVRPLQGRLFGCALAVATAYPHGLAPVTVAALLALDEGTVQRTERAAYGRYRLALQRLDNEARRRQIARDAARTEADGKRSVA